jgi:hypothetical protein
MVGPDGRVEFPAEERMGLLTQPGLLSVLSHRDRTSPVHRGIMVREQLLCQALPPPPPGVSDSLPPPDENQSEQDLLRSHRNNPECSSCHNLIDPIGFAFERYDAVGRYRTKVFGNPIDATGELIGTDVDGEIDGLPALVAKLGQSEQVQSCVADQWFVYALGRNASPSQDSCSRAMAAAAMRTHDGDLREMLVALVVSDSFRYRRIESQ